MTGARRAVLVSCLTLLATTATAFVGCGGKKGPELATVYGKVNLAGKPLPKAQVQFVPEQGRPSVGMTDDAGKYELQYTDNENGAMVGKHTVRISTYQAADEDTGTAAVPESVPAIYNVNSQLTKEVKAGKNEIDFDLEANSPVIQPGGATRPGMRGRNDCGEDELTETETTEYVSE